MLLKNKNNSLKKNNNKKEIISIMGNISSGKTSILNTLLLSNNK